jgi:hypothetical protein
VHALQHEPNPAAVRTAQVGGYYNLISEREHQVSMKLKLGEMWDHNGT